LMYNVQTNKNPRDLKDVRLRVIMSCIVAVTELQKLFVSSVVRHIYNNIFIYIYIEAYYYYDIHYYTRCTDSASDVYIIYITHTH